jgi:MoaA/NifB/PqqE/SkfB family radical SAM enzyme
MEETPDGSPSLASLDGCNVCFEAKAQRPQAVSAGAAELSPEECFKAVEECGAPMVSIPGGEPLLHPQMPEIVAGLVARKKYVYMCTNALLLKEKLHLFKPSKYLSFSVHVDGQREHHDFSVCREGGYDIAMASALPPTRRSSTAPTPTAFARTSTR